MITGDSVKSSEDRERGRDWTRRHWGQTGLLESTARGVTRTIVMGKGKALGCGREEDGSGLSRSWQNSQHSGAAGGLPVCWPLVFPFLSCWNWTQCCSREGYFCQRWCAIAGWHRSTISPFLNYRLPFLYLSKSLSTLSCWYSCASLNLSPFLNCKLYEGRISYLLLKYRKGRHRVLYILAVQ